MYCSYILLVLKDFGNMQLVTAKQIYPLEGSLITTGFWAVSCELINMAPATPTTIGSFPRHLIQWFVRQGCVHSVVGDLDVR